MTDTPASSPERLDPYVASCWGTKREIETNRHYWAVTRQSEVRDFDAPHVVMIGHRDLDPGIKRQMAELVADALNRADAAEAELARLRAAVREKVVELNRSSLRAAKACEPAEKDFAWMAAGAQMALDALDAALATPAREGGEAASRSTEQEAG